jgi:L-fuconolactonase
MQRDAFMRGIAALAEFGLVYDILIVARQLPSATELARAFPQQPFVLDHIAKPDIRGHALDPWRRDIEALAACPNVTCKLSGMVTEADWASWTPDDFAPYVERVVRCFGPERLMFGSDWPVCTLAGDYASVLALAESHLGHLSQDDREAIFGGNAARVYGV